ncbi:hypothetical protein HYDPIDRAFT_119739 [Hydnomerulius pinastri MD-312]|uniref:Uncharacterized protein n=1 Tax=Hydnomerulius pinastri MD-312 TaxID=994086 RepID=A0A0C9VL16_9AGAM|nr:hypothetical protein HYDPIDRAFT_119739 [Hydnomerulius pinastri MD-312]
MHSHLWVDDAPVQRMPSGILADVPPSLPPFLDPQDFTLQSSITPQGMSKAKYRTILPRPSKP